MAYTRRGRPATGRERRLAETALRELDESRLDVVLVPAPRQAHEGHCIRVVQDRNPAWYQEFALRGRCWVKRARVVRALQRVVEGWVRPNSYACELLEVLDADEGKAGQSRKKHEKKPRPQGDDW